jgi:hypothetical protein
LGEVSQIALRFSAEVVEGWWSNIHCLCPLNCCCVNGMIYHSLASSTLTMKKNIINKNVTILVHQAQLVASWSHVKVPPCQGGHFHKEACNFILKKKWALFGHNNGCNPICLFNARSRFNPRCLCSLAWVWKLELISEIALLTQIYLWRKGVCFVLFCFCSYEIHQTRMLQIVFLVSLESSQQGEVHGLGSMTFGAKVLEYWLISSLKIKLN